MAKAPDFSPDVVFIDFGLPDISGSELASRIRTSLPRSVTLVTLSGFGEQEHSEQAAPAGFDRYLMKPEREEELVAVRSDVRRR